jgi:outer membrane protein assembly factor BamB
LLAAAGLALVGVAAGTGGWSPVTWHLSGWHAAGAAHGLVLVGSQREPHRMQALDAATGTPRWSLRQQADQLQSVRATPAGLLLVSQTGVRHVRSGDGEEIWRMLVTGESVGFTGHVLATCRQGLLAAYAPPSGEPLWTDACGELVAGPGVLIATVDEEPRSLARLDPATGARAWSLDLVDQPVLLADRVVARNADELVALSIEDGSELWRRPHPGHVELANGALLSVQTGVVERLDPANGDALWRAELGRDAELVLVDSSPTHALVSVDAQRHDLTPELGVVDLDTGAWTTRPLLVRSERAVLHGDSVIVSSPAGVGLLGAPGDGAPSLAQLLTYPLGFPSELSGHAIDALAADPDQWSAVDWSALDPRATVILLDCIEALGPEQGPQWVLGLLAGAHEEAIRRRMQDVLLSYPDAVLLETLARALADPALQTASRDLLLDLDKPEARTLLADALTQQRAQPYAWDCRAEFFCQDGPDQDADGWPDAFERRMGTDAANADSDGDGLADGLDPCPRLAAHGAPDPRHQAAVDVLLFGLPGGPVVISEPVCFAGVQGPQLPDTPFRDTVVGIGFGFSGEPSPPEEGAQDAVEVDFVTGPNQALGYRVELIFEAGAWVPERVRLAWRS